MYPTTGWWTFDESIYTGLFWTLLCLSTSILGTNLALKHIYFLLAWGFQTVLPYIPGTHLSSVLSPKEGLFQSKQGTFGFQVYIFICFSFYLYIGCFTLVAFLFAAQIRKPLDHHRPSYGKLGALSRPVEVRGVTQRLCFFCSYSLGFGHCSEDSLPGMRWKLNMNMIWFNVYKSLEHGFFVWKSSSDSSFSMLRWKSRNWRRSKLWTVFHRSLCQLSPVVCDLWCSVDSCEPPMMVLFEKRQVGSNPRIGLKIVSDIRLDIKLI